MIDIYKNKPPKNNYIPLKRYQNVVFIKKYNIDIVESKNSLVAIDLAPYTYESDYYIEKCIIEELSQARYTDGTCHDNKLHKGQEYYYGPNYSEREFVKYRKKDAVRKLIAMLKKRVEDLHNQ